MVCAADRHEEKSTGICAAGARSTRHMPVRMFECGCHYYVLGLWLVEMSLRKTGQSENILYVRGLISQRSLECPSEWQHIHYMLDWVWFNSGKQSFPARWHSLRKNIKWQNSRFYNYITHLMFNGKHKHRGHYSYIGTVTFSDFQIPHVETDVFTALLMEHGVWQKIIFPVLVWPFSQSLVYWRPEE